MIQWKPKRRACKAEGCRCRFIAEKEHVWWCSPECGAKLALAKLAKARAKKAKQERAESRTAKQKLKTRRDWMAEAQKAFNAYVRARDEGLPCISCGVSQAAQWDAGHFRSVGAAAHLRFNEDNVHRQCSRPCNKDKSGNLLNYRRGLIERIGLARVEALENDNSTARLSIDDIKAIKEKYVAKKRRLEKARSRQSG